MVRGLMSGALLRSIGVLLLIVALPSSASADAKRGTLADTDTQIAKRHFDRGSTLYDAERYADAIVEFEAAFKFRPLPALFFNIGRCHDRMEHANEAITAYERYLAGAPSAADADEVRARVAVLKARLDVPAPAVTAPAPTAETPDASPHHTLAWVVLGGGVAILAGSLIAGLIADSRYGSLKAGCAADGGCNASTVPNAQNTIDSGKAAGIASDVLLGIGLAALGAGVVLYLVSGQRPVEQQRAWRVTPIIGLHGGGLGLGWSL